MRVVNNVLSGDFKLGILRYAACYDKYFKGMLEEKGLAHELVTEFHYVLAMSREHSLAEKEEIAFADLRPYIEIAHADPYVPSVPLAMVKKEELPDDMDRRIFVFERASQFELLSQNHETFMWLSPVPQTLLDRYGTGRARLPGKPEAVQGRADLPQGLPADRTGPRVHHRAVPVEEAVSIGCI